MDDVLLLQSFGAEAGAGNWQNELALRITSGALFGAGLKRVRWSKVRAAIGRVQQLSGSGLKPTAECAMWFHGGPNGTRAMRSAGALHSGSP
jgi:hypothetical protein